MSMSAMWGSRNSGHDMMSPSKCCAKTTLPAPIIAIFGFPAIAILLAPNSARATDRLAEPQVEHCGQVR
jgi:hypothetical protein